MEDKILLEWFRNTLHAYLCGTCGERFHLEKVVYPSEVVCPYCHNDDVSINSVGFKKNSRLSKNI
jgi:Zn finger protein HypA/HybF involved in hydrogenase expression